jgi:hypothetical protein
MLVGIVWIDVMGVVMGVIPMLLTFNSTLGLSSLYHL